MKTHTNPQTKNKSVSLENSACCSSKTEILTQGEEPCCEQPVDGTTCCDKNLSKNENSEKTGCC